MYAKLTTTSLLIMLVSGMVARADVSSDGVVRCSASELVGPAFPRLDTAEEVDAIVKLKPFRMVALQRLPDVRDDGVEQAGLTYEDPSLQTTPPLPPDIEQSTIAQSCQQCCPLVCGECYQCCDCCPKWTFRVGAVFLTRNRPSNVVLITTGRATTSQQILNAGQYDLGTGWGYELDAIRHRFLGTCLDGEVRYFGVYGWNSSIPAAQFPGEFAQYAAPFGLAAPTIASSSYTSQLQSFEANLRKDCRPWLQVLGGFRWVELTDRIVHQYNVGPGTFQSTDRVNANNALFGAQVGADAFLWQGNRLGIDAIGKAGIYGNAASNNLLITQTLPGVADVASGGSRGQTAFVGEMGFTGRYALTNKLSLRATYELLWLDGVATASDQPPGQLFAGNANRVTTNTVFYNGMFMGIECKH